MIEGEEWRLFKWCGREGLKFLGVGNTRDESLTHRNGPASASQVVPE